MNFPEKEIMIDSTFGSRMYLTQDIDAWRESSKQELRVRMGIAITGLPHDFQTRIFNTIQRFIEDCL